jgi:DnaK suppressor protein
MAVTTEDIIVRLRAELEAARQELAEYTEEATHPPEVELGGGSPGYSTWQTAVVLRQHIEQRVADLEDAIGRAEKGLYGICEACGVTIPPERLEALPFTTFCVPCAEKHAGRARF